VDRIQVSDDPDFGTYTEFVFIGPTADIPWTVQATGAVYIRAVDRAGNTSEISYGKGPADHEVFLPLVLRG
jgi:hypothetical protein